MNPSRRFVFRHALALFLTAAAPAVVACSAALEDDTSNSVDDLTSTTPIPPAELVACWVVADTSTNDPFFQAHQLKCAATKPATYPLAPARIMVEARTPSGRVVSAMFSEGEQALGIVRSDDFPLEVRTRISFARTGEIGDGFTLKHEARIERLTSATPEQKLGVRVPLTLWPVEIKSTVERRVFVSARYSVPTPGFRVGANFTIPETDPEELALAPFVEIPNGTKELFLIAPKDAQIDVTVNGKPGKIPGPGTYVWNGESLVKDTTDRPGAPPAAGSSAAPAPTCGTDGQAPCTGGSCAPSHKLEGGTCKACGAASQPFCVGPGGARSCNDGHRLDGNDNLCKPCGNAGQTYCANTSGARSCNDGHRLDGNDNLCKACGRAGQTYCTTSNGARFCAEAHRLDGNDNLCKPCGKAGQTYCATSNGARFCAEAHRLDGNDNLCKPCGGEGQTYCADTNGRRFCDAGLRLDSNTATCVR